MIVVICKLISILCNWIPCKTDFEKSKRVMDLVMFISTGLARFLAFAFTLNAFDGSLHEQKTRTNHGSLKKINCLDWTYYHSCVEAIT